MRKRVLSMLCAVMMLCCMTGTAMAAEMGMYRKLFEHMAGTTKIKTAPMTKIYIQKLSAILLFLLLSNF